MRLYVRLWSRSVIREYVSLCQVKVNLGVALIQAGNAATAMSGPDGFGPAYGEAARLFSAALQLRPGHAGAARNLELARRNWRLRAGMAAADNDPAVPSDDVDGLTSEDKESDQEDVEWVSGNAPDSSEAAAAAERLRIRLEAALLREQAVRDARRDARPAGALAYLDALYLAMGGTVREDVLEAMRWENYDVEHSARAFRRVTKLAGMAEALVCGAHRAMTAKDSAADAAGRTVALKEAAALYRTVLRCQPHNAVAVRGLAVASASETMSAVAAAVTSAGMASGLGSTTGRWEAENLDDSDPGFLF